MCKSSLDVSHTAYATAVWNHTFFVRRIGPFLHCPYWQSLDIHLDPFPAACIPCNSRHHSHRALHRWHTSLDKIHSCIHRKFWPKCRGERMSHIWHIGRRIFHTIGRSRHLAVCDRISDLDDAWPSWLASCCWDPDQGFQSVCERWDGNWKSNAHKDVGIFWHTIDKTMHTKFQLLTSLFLMLFGGKFLQIQLCISNPHFVYCARVVNFCRYHPA